VGTIDWDGDLLLPERAIPRFLIDERQVRHPNPEYRREAWLVQGRGAIRIARFTANAIDLEVQCSQPTTLVVNQNYHHGWGSSVGEVGSHDGLLAVTGLAAGRRHTVRLRYAPTLFRLGLAVSLASLAVIAYMSTRRLRMCGLYQCIVGTDPPPGRSAREVRVPFRTWNLRTRLLVLAGVAGAISVLGLAAVPALRADYALRAAELLLVNDQTRRAADLCHRLLRRDPNNLAAREILAASYYDQGRYREAVSELRRAVQLGRMRPMSYARWARAHHRLGELAEAEAAYRQAIAAYPGLRDPRQELAIFLRRARAGKPPWPERDTPSADDSQAPPADDARVPAAMR
jgi:tetratricopeptide (TPR) repeat protein